MNLGRTHRYRAWLVPYAEGTLDAARTARLEAQLARDPALALEADRVRAVTARLREAAAHAPAQSDPRLALDPASLWPRVLPRLAAPPRRVPRPAQWAGGACAASLALAAVLLHSTPSRVATALPVRPVPARVAQGVGNAPPTALLPPRVRHKKAGRRTVSRPAHPALVALQVPPPARLAVLPPALPSEPTAPPSPVAVPAPTTPSAHAAVALEGGPAQFRLASPVHDTTPKGTARPAPDASAPRPPGSVPRLGSPAPPDTASQAQDAPASSPDIPPSAAPVSAPAVPDTPRKARRQRRRARHHPRRHAPSAAAPLASGSPAAPPPPARNPRTL